MWSYRDRVKRPHPIPAIVTVNQGRCSVAVAGYGAGIDLITGYRTFFSAPAEIASEGSPPSAVEKLVSTACGWLSRSSI